MPVRRSHSRAGERRQVVDVGVEHDEEVVAESVVLGEGRHAAGQLASASTTAGTTSATGSRSTSIQRTRGSRRNHRSWRTANWRVRSDDRGDGLVERDPPVEVLEQLLVAERLARRSATSRRRRRARPRRAGRRPSSPRPGRRRARPAPVAASAARSSSTAVGGYACRPGPNELNGRPLPSVTSSARTVAARLPGSMRAGGDRVELAEPPVRARPASGSASSSARTSGHCPGISRRSSDGGQVQAGAGDEQRPAGDRRHRRVVGGAVVGDGERRRTARRGRGRGGRRRPGRPASAWPCRCPCPGTPAWRRRRRSRCRRRHGPPPSRRPTCPTPSGRARRPGRARSEGGDGDAHAVRGSASTLDEPPGEVVRRGAGDLDRGVGAGPQRTRRREVDEAVLGGAGGDDGRVLLARADRRGPPRSARPGPRWRRGRCAR